jgi:hypothetical protein
MTKCIDCSAMGGTAQDCLCQVLANVEKKLLNRERRRALISKENARRRIIVPTDDQLAHCSVQNRTAMIVRNTGLARRPFVEFCADMVYGFADTTSPRLMMCLANLRSSGCQTSRSLQCVRAASALKSASLSACASFTLPLKSGTR